MNIGRVILIVLAIAIAGGAAYLVKFLLDKQREDVTASQGSGMDAVEVLVADRPLARGVITTAEHFVWANWPARNINPNYIVRKEGTKAADFIGRAILAPVAAGEPILLPKLLKPGTASFLEAVLKPGMRGFTLRVNTLTNNAGFVLPGIHVDVLWSYKVKYRTAEGRRETYQASETLRQNVRVLAIDSNLSETTRTKQKAARSKYVTLEVTPKDAEIFTVAQRTGRLRLLVRSLKRNPEKERLHSVTTQFDIGIQRRRSGFGLAAGVRLVLVAIKELPVGKLMGERDFEWRPLPPRSNVDGLISLGRSRSDIDSLIFLGQFGVFSFTGALVTKAVLQGQPIPRLSLILATENRFLAKAVENGKRAIKLRGIFGSIDRRYLAAGDLLDIRFDGTRKYQGNIGFRIKPELAFSEVIVSKARILSMLGGITVEVSPSDANRLRVAMLSRNGKLSYSVRAPDDSQILPSLSTELEVSKHGLNALSGIDPMINSIRRQQRYNRNQIDQTGDFDSTIKIYRATRQSRIVVTE